MAINKLKRAIVFSNEQIKKTLECLLEDEAEITRASVSGVIERLLINNYLPENNDALFWIELLTNGSWGIGDALGGIFDYLTAGIDRKPKHNNCLPLVEYARSQHTICTGLPDPMNPRRFHFLRNLESISTRLELASDSQDLNTPRRLHCKDDANHIKDLHKIESEQFGTIPLSCYYLLIIQNWDILYDWSITYSLITDLVHLQQSWETTPRSRLELVRIIKSVSKEW